MLIEYFIVYIYCFITVLFFFSSGIFFNNYILKSYNNIIENGLLGIIFLSFLALFFNFFSSLNSHLNNIFLLFLLYPLLNQAKDKKIEILKYSLIISFIGFLTFILDNSNRPDAGLYHLPYISILNENKILIGSVNLHFRFGHTSILQYLSAIFYNDLFKSNGILIPLTILYGFSIVFFLKETFNKKNDNLLKFFCFLISIWILTSMNRYSEFGNDDPAHFFYFILIFYLLRENFNNATDKIFNKVLLISLYIFFIKQFYLLIFFYPIFLIIKMNYKKKILNLNFAFCCIFLTLWTIKNIMISTCVLYPLQFTCFENFIWYPNQIQTNPNNIAITSEAWAKAFPDRIDKSISEIDYISNYDWINTWIRSHFIYIIKKILVIFLSLSLILFFLVKSKPKKNIFFPRGKIIFFILLHILFVIIWFLKTPTYRYGSGYIAILIIILLIYLFKDRFYNLDFTKKFTNITFVVIFLISTFVIIKNNIRILKKYNINYTDYPWPIKNSFQDPENKKNINIAYKEAGELIYYLPYPDNLCMYSSSPCAHGASNVKKTKIFYNLYDLYYSNKIDF